MEFCKFEKWIHHFSDVWKKTKELIVKLEAYKADIMIDEFREVAQQIIAKNDQYILDIQDNEKEWIYLSN